MRARHVGKFPRDHRSQVLRQTKGAWLHTVIFCRIYGAPSLRLYYRILAERVSHEYDVGMRIFSLTSIRLVDYRETGRALSRVKRHTRDLYVAQFYGAFRSFPRSYKVDIVNFYCIVWHTRHAVNFFQILLRILVTHCLTNVTIPRGYTNESQIQILLFLRKIWLSCIYAPKKNIFFPKYFKI